MWLSGLPCRANPAACPSSMGESPVPLPQDRPLMCQHGVAVHARLLQWTLCSSATTAITARTASVQAGEVPEYVFSCCRMADLEGADKC